jgi:hypothetical protein
VKIPDLFQKLIEIINHSAMHGQHFSIFAADDHGRSAWVSERFTDLAFFVGYNGVRCPVLLLKGFDPFCIVPERQAEKLDVFTQYGIFLDRVVEPVNYRRSLLARRSEDAHCIDTDHLGRDIGQGECIPFYAEVSLVLRGGQTLESKWGQGHSRCVFAGVRRISCVAQKNQAHESQQHEGLNTHFFVPHPITSMKEDKDLNPFI